MITPLMLLLLRFRATVLRVGHIPSLLSFRQIKGVHLAQIENVTKNLPRKITATRKSDNLEEKPTGTSVLDVFDRTID
jgi:hypothetical protein